MRATRDNDAVAGVDGGLPSELHVLGLRLQYADLCLQAIGARDLGQDGAGGDRLPGCRGISWSTPVTPERTLRASTSARRKAGWIGTSGLRLLGSDLGRHPLGLGLEALLLEAEATLELDGEPLGLPLLERREKSSAQQPSAVARLRASPRSQCRDATTGCCC
jgi:hypothetical protein